MFSKQNLQPKVDPRMAARTHGCSSALFHPWVRAAIRGLIFFFCVVTTQFAYAQKSSPHFRTMLVGTLGLPDDSFLEFVERVKPEVVVMGAFGAPQWSAQEDPRAWLEKWRVIFRRMHRCDVKVIGMIELLNVGNSVAEAEKFIDFCDKRWDKELLGGKLPVKAIELLEKRTMPREKQVGAHAPRGCAINPHWRMFEKAIVKALIDAGIDGFITHRNMFGQCGCPFCHAETHTHTNPKRQPENDAPKESNLICDHCRQGFRHWLADRYDAEQLKSRFNITNLNKHRLPAIYGHHREHERLPTPIELEGMKFARHAIKECYDDVFVQFGRSVKKDLIVAQWNHMPYFDELHLDGGHIPRWHMTTFGHASANERWSLPIELWGRGEDFYWYCNWGTCQNTQLDKRFLADITLYAKLLRSQARGKPYVINKYDFYRPRNMMAEAAALGMLAGAIAVPYRTPEDADTMVRYFDFTRRHRGIFADNNGESVAEVLLVYPRTVTHAGDAEALEMIEVAGRTMITEHIQFDFVSDDMLPSVDLKKYRVVVAGETAGLTKTDVALIAVPRTKKKADDPKWKELQAVVVSGLQPHTGGTAGAEPFRAALLKALNVAHIRFVAPYTVETHVYRQPGKYVIHLVNYNHNEKASGKPVVERESPIAAPQVEVALPLPRDGKVKQVTFLDPNRKELPKLDFQQHGREVVFKTPSFLVYGVCVVELQ